MSADFIFEKILVRENALVDIIFVHGLTGDVKETWSSESGDGNWPEWLSEDVETISTYSLGYPASLFEKWAKKEMDIFERAGNVLEHLTAHEIGRRPVVFVAHSLGGLLTKILLRMSQASDDEDFKNISSLTKLIVFLSTPHTGSSLANALEALPKTSKSIALLANETGFLEDLKQHFISFVNERNDVLVKTYYEKYKTKKAALVVTRESANPGTGSEPIAVDKDHINICKPNDKEDVVYLGVKRHISNLIRTVLDETPAANTEFLDMDYSKKSDKDRRDLLEKLVDADLEHEYQTANDAQNEFARRFVKTGLYTAARDDHDMLLSEVETRFITQIYHPLICKDSGGEKIKTAIQEKVIDAIAEKKIGETKFAPKVILCALYYLTEQCHIKWDYNS